MDRKKNILEAVRAFQKQYPSITSGDLQAFVLGTQACEKIMQEEIDGETEVNQTLTQLLVMCLDKETLLVQTTGRTLLGEALITEITEFLDKQYKMRMKKMDKEIKDLKSELNGK